MASAVSVTTSATLIATAGGVTGRPSQIIITNDSGNDVYLGKDATVTTSNGVKVPTTGAFGIELAAGRTIYGIAGSTSEVRVEVWD